MSQSPTIKNCPFCDNDQVEIGEIEPGRYAVDCPECQCIGPFGDDMIEAIDKWNVPHSKCLSIEAEVRKINAWSREVGAVKTAKAGAEA